MAGGEEEEEGQWSVRRNVYLNVFYAFYVDGIRGSGQSSSGVAGEVMSWGEEEGRKWDRKKWEDEVRHWTRTKCFFRGGEINMDIF